MEPRILMETVEVRDIRTLPVWIKQRDGMSLVEFLNGFWRVLAFWNGQKIVQFQGGDLHDRQNFPGLSNKISFNR